MPQRRAIRSAGLRVVLVIEDVGLFLILIATVVAAGQEIARMVIQQRVKVTDLLMLFIFLEVISMVSTYWRLNKLPVRMPLYIAMVSLARFLILDVGGGHNMFGLTDIYISLAIFVLAVAVLVVRYGHLKLPYPVSERLDSE